MTDSPAFGIRAERVVRIVVGDPVLVAVGSYGGDVVQPGFAVGRVGGAALAEIRDAAPFIHLTGRFEVPDNDPAQVTESEWQHLRTRAAEADWPEFHALVEAAYREPALRALYPFTSHWTLRFSTNTRPSITDLGLFLNAHRGSRYTLNNSLVEDEVLGEAPTAEELVSMAARHLPPDLGPVTLGA